MSQNGATSDCWTYKKSRLGPGCHVSFFSARFPNMCMPRTTFYLLLQASPPGLAFHGSGLACLLSWLGMVNVGWLCSMRSDLFELSHLKLSHYLLTLVLFNICRYKLTSGAIYLTLWKPNGLSKRLKDQSI